MGPRSSKKAPISNVADCNQSILPISIIVLHFINDFDVLFCFIYLFSSSSLFSFFLHTNILLFSFQADMLYKIVKYVQLFSLVLWFICFFHASILIQLRHLQFHFICLPLYRCFVTHDYLYTNTSFFSVFPFFRFSVLRFTFFRFRFSVLRFTFYVLRFSVSVNAYAHAYAHALCTCFMLMLILIQKR